MIETPISDFLVPARIAVAEAGDTVAHAATLMAESPTGCVLITDAGLLVGIFTERDFLMRVAAGGRDPERTPLGDVMTSGPETLHADDQIYYAINRMAVGGYRHVPVLDRADKPVGVLAVRDVVEHLTEVFSAAEAGELDPADDPWTDIGGGG